MSARLYDCRLICGGVFFSLSFFFFFLARQELEIPSTVGAFRKCSSLRYAKEECGIKSQEIGQNDLNMVTLKDEICFFLNLCLLFRGTFLVVFIWRHVGVNLTWMSVFGEWISLLQVQILHSKGSYSGAVEMNCFMFQMCSQLNSVNMQMFPGSDCWCELVWVHLSQTAPP